jgi:hypothetical protein
MTDGITYQGEAGSAIVNAGPLIGGPGDRPRFQRTPKRGVERSGQHRAVGGPEVGGIVLGLTVPQRHVQAEAHLARANAADEHGTGAAQEDVSVALAWQLHVVEQ